MEMQQPKPQRRIAKAKHAPWSGDSDGDEDRGVYHAPAVMIQYRRDPKQERSENPNIEEGDQAAAACEIRKALQTSGRGGREPSVHMTFPIIPVDNILALGAILN
jgi:hypothetical protein